MANLVRELQGDLARKYKMHAVAVGNIWRSFDESQRAKCLRAGAANGIVLKHSSDASMGNVHMIIPEWNLRDIAECGPEFLLELLRYRATQSPFEQYRDGVNGGAGDRAFIEAMRTKGLQHAEPFKNCYTFFWDDERYGESYRVLSNQAHVLKGFEPAIHAGLCIPQSTGELILQRQTTLLQSLNIMIEDILDQGSPNRDRTERPRKPDTAASTALSKSTIQAQPVKISLPELVASALNQKDSLEEYLSLISTEPVVLAHVVNIWYFSRPELVPDQKGRRLPLHTDRYISTAFFEAIHSAIIGAAIWSYISRLLNFLESAASDKVYRAVILQELSNCCHLEYGRAQAIFKRHVQSGTGSKRFYRLSTAQDSGGIARVIMKGNPDDLTRVDPQLHYMLRLCQSQTNASEAGEWLQKLNNLHQSHPTEREKLTEREADALSDLVVIVGFSQEVASLFPMPSFSHKKGNMFVSRSHDLEVELNGFKSQVDLSDFVVPIDHLLEPGMSQRALETLDRFVVDRAGTKIGLLYQDIIEECFCNLHTQYQQITENIRQKDRIEVPPIAVPTQQPREKQLQERKEKEKTRPPHSAAYEIVPRPDFTSQEGPSLPPPTLKVRPSTVEVFSNLFAKSQSRGSINWDAFQAAMSDIGFSAMPKYGSVYTFFPPNSLQAKRAFTVHRPHKSRIEGYMILIFARRLKRLYGWDEGTFEVV